MLQDIVQMNVHACTHCAPTRDDVRRRTMQMCRLQSHSVGLDDVRVICRGTNHALQQPQLQPHTSIALNVHHPWVEQPISSMATPHHLHHAMLVLTRLEVRGIPIFAIRCVSDITLTASAWHAPAP